MNKFDFYEKVKNQLDSAGFIVSPNTEISYGLQFYVTYNGQKCIVRIYESKKGLKLDLSQVRNPETKEMIESCMEMECSGDNIKPLPVKKVLHTDDPDELVGTDESGKGDYFGPLAAAGVYADFKTSEKLKSYGVDDSKKLSDKRIKELSDIIKDLCPYSIVSISNEKYNELYGRVKNLNRLLAWCHARAIENVLSSVECKYVLSDQFGDASLIENALMERGRKVTLLQRPRAEENTAVAAASILARDEFVSRIEEMGKKYDMVFPKGASFQVLKTAREFVKVYGMDELVNVAKLHFKTTEEIEE